MSNRSGLLKSIVQVSRALRCSCSNVCSSCGCCSHFSGLAFVNPCTFESLFELNWLREQTVTSLFANMAEQDYSAIVDRSEELCTTVCFNQPSELPVFFLKAQTSTLMTRRVVGPLALRGRCTHMYLSVSALTASGGIVLSLV